MNVPSRCALHFACLVLIALPLTATAAGDPVNGKALYDANCANAKCHNPNPIGGPAMYGANDVDEIQYAIANVKEMKQESSLKLLTVDQLTDIAAYLGTYLKSANLNYQGIWWNASENGWGINFAHQLDTVFASWFTYDVNGRGWWLVMSAQKTGTGVYTGDLYQTHGPAFNAVPFDPILFGATKVGTGTLTFTDAKNGTFNYVIGAVDQTKAITRQVFGILPVCTYGMQPDLTLATNYQDLWWAKPAASESGWGINLNHEGDTIFATWFTYDVDGTPLWLVVTAPKSGPGVYTGDLYRTSGARYDAYDPSKFVPTKVGTATFTFTDGNNATFHYDITGVGPAPVSQTKAITRQIFYTLGTTCQ